MITIIATGSLSLLLYNVMLDFIWIGKKMSRSESSLSISMSP